MKRTIKGIFACVVLGMMLMCVVSAQSVVKSENAQDTCIVKYTALIASAPRNDDNYAERARCHYFKSNELRTSSNGHTAASDSEIELALADAQKAIDLNPKNTNALNVRGIVKSYKGDEIAARVDFDRVIELDPRAFKAYMNRGIGKNRLKDYAGAIADYTKVIEIATPMSATYSERGISYYNLSKKNEAIADFNKALQLDPKNKQATDALAKINSTATTTPTPTRRIPTPAEINEQARQITPEMRKKTEELQRSTKALGDAADKRYPDSSTPKTDAEWEKIAADFKLKIEDAVEKKKDDELAIKIYGEFDRATERGRFQQPVKYIRRQILRVMFQKGGLKLPSFVFKEMDKLKYTKEDRYVVLNSAIYV
ncbi:MAG: tetratricopeptide repeat protein [Chloracidobacterium sp.]|nr:tetratricopeptide repeat protein [Chloracidobacterium sp.]